MMTKYGSIASLVALALIGSPASAGVREAALASAGDQARTRTGMFAGASYRLALDGRGQDRRGRATLKFAGMTRLPGEARLTLADGLEVGRSRTGKPALFLAGMDSGQLGRTMNLDGGETALVVLGGLVVVGGVLLLVGRSQWDDEELDW